MARGRIIALCVVTSACAASTSPAVQPTIDVASGQCPVASDARARLAQVIAAHRAESDLVVRVDATPGDDATELHLRVSRTRGEVGVDRTFTLGPGDCASGGELLALAVDRFLTSFPDWAGPPRPTPPPERWIDLSLIGAANAIWRPLGFDGELGAIIDVGSRRHRFGGGLVARASFPQAAGKGTFQQTSLLGIVGYRAISGPWQLRIEARAGALLVTGRGFDDNRSDALPWWEGVVYAGRVLSFGSVGLEVAASGLRHKAVTSDGLVSEDIPLLRVGLAGEIGIASKSP